MRRIGMACVVLLTGLFVSVRPAGALVTGNVSGVVVDADGHPVAGVSIFASGPCRLGPVHLGPRRHVHGVETCLDTQSGTHLLADLVGLFP